ncbi:MAG: MBOAT family protein [Clostridiales bacterium]|nr:MBOAT family protein [Clostridiales bacterium]
MVFSSLFFVFFFLALNLVVYNFANTIKQKNMVMLVFSLIFYSWGGPKYLLLLTGMVFCSWIFALLIDQYRDTGLCKWFLIGNCVFMLGLLVIFKYLTFFTGITHSIFHFPKEVPQIVLPIGISFYTFQLLSYVIDVYRQEVKPQRKFSYLLLYASLFHQCIAGPIVRYQLVADEIENRKVKLDEMCQGIKRFTVGLAKKAILANGCAVVADTLLPTAAKDLAGIPAAGIWVGLLFYGLQIYLDFSAYSDMAIGMGLMIGFHYDENFNYPYIANSIKEFWKRWHISLSTFFRDYVYIPLGGSRKGERRTTINLLVVWGLTGLWHGASWNYIFWGLYFFIFIFMENKFLKSKLLRLPSFVSHIYAMVVVYFGWALFRCESAGSLGVLFKGMLGLNKNGFINASTSIVIQNNLFLLIFCIVASTPFFKNFGAYVKRLHLVNHRIPYLVYIYDMAMPAVFMILSLLALVGNSYNPFLYFQF